MNIVVIVCFLVAAILFALATFNVSSERINLTAAGLLALTIGLILSLGIIP